MLVGEALLDRQKVVARQGSVAGHAVVGDPSVEGRGDDQPPGPAVGGERALDGGQVGVAQAHEASLGHGQHLAARLAQAAAPGEQTATEVELEAVVEHLAGVGVEVGPVGGGERQRQPARDVDQALVLDDASGDLGPQPVVGAGEVGAGVVDAVVGGLGQGPAGGQVAVAERAQRLAQALLLGDVAVVGPQPLVGARRSLTGGGHRGSGRSSSNRWRNARTSSVSASRWSAAVGRSSSPTTTPRPSPRTATNASSSVTSSPT